MPIGVLKKFGKEHLSRGNFFMELKAVMQPESLAKAKILLSSLDKPKLLAGGTDLVLELNEDKLQAENIIDISKIEELKKICNYGHHVVLGSAVTFTDLLNSEIFKNRFSCLRDCSEMMGSPQIRNRATIGGNIVNAAAACDISPCLMSLEAVLIIENITQKRLVKISEYFKDYNKNKLRPNEILTGIILNDTESSTGFYKLGKRNSLSIARINAAVSLKLTENKIKDFKLTLGAVGRYPFRAYEVEQLVNGKESNYLFEEQVLNIIQNKIDESIKGRPTLPFKREAVKGVYLEALKKALKREGL